MELGQCSDSLIRYWLDRDTHLVELCHLRIMTRALFCLCVIHQKKKLKIVNYKTKQNAPNANNINKNNNNDDEELGSQATEHVGLLEST